MLFNLLNLIVFYITFFYYINYTKILDMIHLKTVFLNKQVKSISDNTNQLLSTAINVFIKFSVSK